MTHHVLPPLGVALTTGFVLPVLLVRARWPAQAPRLAVAMWGALGLLFTFSVSMVAVQWLLSPRTSHWFADWLGTCLPWSEQDTVGGELVLSTADWVALGLGVSLMSVPLLSFARELFLARRKRGRHADRLRLVGSWNSDWGITVVDHAVPAVYCLPGRAPQVVATTGALHSLTDWQLRSVLEHERAHVAGRHHVPVAAAEGFAAVFRWLPLARRLRANVPLLLEMAADDRALRSCSRACLATALFTLAVTELPRVAFAAGGASAALRVRRILTPHRRVWPALRGLTSAAGALYLLTFAVGVCCSAP
ncbi:M56 family peptidase [Streptomyces sp. AJS327]|uniref:M56 family metallopeptidase n=1 Tax=Streptomyces sp. AJS327 TaxID=2545265 RepID=UPI0015DD7BBE|nr:M56 family metallopeptidase [Streptomyces sp. AJS327]MBA0053157.1 M56 family peptidase [Streptomyces sp. AJS327]